MRISEGMRTSRAGQSPSQADPISILDPGGTVLATFWRENTRGPDVASSITVNVAGDVDGDTAPALEAMLAAALDESATVVCDLSRVGFFGAAGVTALVTAQDHAGGSRFLLRGLHGLTEQVLRICGLDNVPRDERAGSR
jgi:anti-anti-sigma factor